MPITDLTSEYAINLKNEIKAFYEKLSPYENKYSLQDAERLFTEFITLLHRSGEMGKDGFGDGIEGNLRNKEIRNAIHNMKDDIRAAYHKIFSEMLS